MYFYSQMLRYCVGALFSHLAIWTLVETVDAARQSALCSHQTGCLPPEVLESGRMQVLATVWTKMRYIMCSVYLRTGGRDCTTSQW